VSRDKRLPFEVVADPFYSAANMERLRSAIADAKVGRNMTEHELIEVEDD
jgi:DNA-damage-inducible protein J